MKEFQVEIPCKRRDKEALALILFRAGFDVYESFDKGVCFKATAEQVTEISYGEKK